MGAEEPPHMAVVERKYGGKRREPVQEGKVARNNQSYLEGDLGLRGDRRGKR